MHNLTNYSMYRFIIFVLIGLPLLADGQNVAGETIGREINEEIVYDFKKNLITPNDLPFDVPFVLTGKVPKQIRKVTVTIINSKYQCRGGEDCPKVCKTCEGLLTKADKEALARQTKEEHSEDLTNSQLEQAQKRQSQSEKTEGDEVLKDKADCACKEPCSSNYFKICEELCPWELTFLNKETTDGKGNTFSVTVPPLKANQSYQFFFQFERSVADERKVLAPKLVPAIRSSFFNEYNADSIIDLANQKELQAKLGELVTSYYDETYYMNLDLAGQVLDPTNPSAFQALLDPSISTLFANRQAALTNLGSTVTNGTTKWTGILGDVGFNQLLNGLRGQSSLTAQEKEVFDQLNQLNLPPVTRDNIFHGKADLSEPYIELDAPVEVMLTSSIDPYLAKVVNSQKAISALLINLSFLESNVESRRKIFLTTDEQKQHLDLLKVPSPTTQQRNQLAALNLKVSTLSGNIPALKGKLTDLFNLFASSKNDLAQLKKDLAALDAYFGKVANDSFGELRINISQGLPTTADYKTRTGYSVTLDAGFAHIFYEDAFSNEVRPYFGVNFHLGPINKQVKYRAWRKGCTFRSNLRALYNNTSFIVGVTTTSLADGDRMDTFGTMSILTGFGIRILDPVRISGGWVWNQIESANPLENNKSLKRYPYMAVSFDLDVGKYLGSFGKKVGLTN